MANSSPPSPHNPLSCLFHQEENRRKDEIRNPHSFNPNIRKYKVGQLSLWELLFPFLIMESLKKNL